MPLEIVSLQQKFPFYQKYLNLSLLQTKFITRKEKNKVKNKIGPFKCLEETEIKLV